MQSESEKLVVEANRLAELEITSQAQVMLAADQRATTFAGIMIAAVAVTAQRTDVVNASWQNHLGLVLLGLSAGLAAVSARSIKVFFAGNAYENFEDDIKKNRELVLVMRDMGRIYDNCSKMNRAKIATNARLFNAALYVGILGFVMAIWPSVLSLITSAANQLTHLKGCG